MTIRFVPILHGLGIEGACAKVASAFARDDLSQILIDARLPLVALGFVKSEHLLAETD